MFATMLYKNVVTYIDDVVGYANSFEEMNTVLAMILTMI